MLSNYRRYFKLAAYLSTFTQEAIVIAMGVPTLRELFKEKHYADLDGAFSFFFLFLFSFFFLSFEEQRARKKKKGSLFSLPLLLLFSLSLSFSFSLPSTNKQAASSRASAGS